MISKKHTLYLFLVILFAPLTLLAQSSGLAPVGNLWVVVVDDSQELPAFNKLKWSDSRWQQIVQHCPIDYAHDHVLCAYSGCNDSPSESFGPQFVHFQSLKKVGRSANDMGRLVRDVLEHRTGKYASAYVSVVNYVTLEQAVQKLKSDGCARLYRDIFVMTLTSDGQELDTWNLDQRSIRKLGRLPEVLRAKRFLAGGGRLAKTFEDNSALPHVRVYRYATRQSQPITDGQGGIFALATQPDATAHFSLKSLLYQGDSIVACFIDTVAMNGKDFPMGRLLQSQELGQRLSVRGRNAFHSNRYEIRGTLRVQYVDSVYGAHYRDVHFVQKMESPSPVFHRVCTIMLKVLLWVLAVAFAVFGLWLPQRRLYVIYVGERKYVVRRGYTSHWHKSLPLMVLEFDEEHRLRVCGVDRWRVSERKLRYKPQPSQKEPYCRLSESILVESCSILNISKLNRNLEEIGRYETGKRQVCLEYVSTITDLDEEKYICNYMFYADWIKNEYHRTLVSKVRKCSWPVASKLAALMAKCAPRHYACIAFMSDSSERIVIRKRGMKNMGFIDFKIKNE